MALDGITTAAITSQLNHLLKDARISKIAQPENDALIITFKTYNRETIRLLMSASASLPLIYITQTNQPSPATAPNFCMLLRKHIGNARIISVTSPSLERVIRFEAEHYDELGDLRRKVLILELMGKHSNIIFCDDEGKIIDSIKHISAQTSSVREVLPGRDYFIPETMHKLDPRKIGCEDFLAAVCEKPLPLPKAIYTALTGFSPQIANELCFRCNLDDNRSAMALSEGEKLHLYRQFSLLMEDIASENFGAYMYLKDEDPVEFSPVPLRMYQDLECREYPGICELLEDFYRMRDKTARIRQKSSDLRRITGTLIDRTAKKLQLQTRQMQDTKKKDRYRLYGELLHTYGYMAGPEDKEITVTNYYDGEEVVIPLDPQLSAADNVAKYFERYTKLKRTAAALETQIKESEEELAHLESIRTFLEMALSEDDLVQVREELADAGYIRRKSAGGKKVKIRSVPYHYVTKDGFDLYVGKNNYQNDELTFKFASGNDWWFHAKKMPGSHVILKNPGTPIPDHVFEQAAALAAYYSSGRAAGKVEIDYVKKKEVKKPSGAKPGFVVYYTNYSMTIAPDISALTLV